MANSPSGDSVLDRVVRILRAFDPAHPALAVDELAKRADLPLSTAYRLVSEMSGHGLLQRDRDGRIRVGVTMWEYANRASNTVAFARAARPHMRAVQDVVGENTQLGILRDGEVLVIERMSSPSAVVHRSEAAGRLPAHLTSMGAVLLAFARSRVRESYLSQPLTPGAESAPRRASEVRQMLKRVQATKYAQLDGWLDDGVTGLSVPVYDDRGEVAAALGAVVPTEGRVSSTAIIRALRKASAAITRGFDPLWILNE